MDERIHAQIVAGEITALTLDTSIFDRAGLAMEAGLLAQLSQFRDSDIRLVIASTVANEVRRHLAENAEKATGALQNALRDTGRHQALPAAVQQQVAEAVDAASMETRNRACQRFDDWVARVGATVLNEAQAEEALAAGASFLVSPGLSPGLARWAEALGLPYLPGVATPTEVQEALALGLRLLKFFPAEAMGGVRTLKAYAPVFPGVRFVPTGGIGPETLEAYLALENVLACGGSWLLEGSLEEVRTKLRGLGKLRPQAQR